MDTQEPHMKRCLALAKEGLSKGNPSVGAVIVHDGSIIAKRHLDTLAARCMNQLQHQQQ